MQTYAVGSTAAGSAGGSARGMDALGSEDFFRLLVTELRNQDPLEPTKTADMIGQVTDIRTIELSKQLTDVLALLASQQRTAGAGELLGRHVTAVVRGADGAPREVSGIVTGVRFDADGSAVLELDTGEAVLAAAVTRVLAAETAEQVAGAGGASAAAPAEDKAQDTARPRAAGPQRGLSLSGLLRL